MMDFRDVVLEFEGVTSGETFFF